MSYSPEDMIAYLSAYRAERVRYWDRAGEKAPFYRQAVSDILEEADLGMISAITASLHQGSSHVTTLERFAAAYLKARVLSGHDRWDHPRRYEQDVRRLVDEARRGLVALPLIRIPETVEGTRSLTEDEFLLVFGSEQRHA